MNDRDVPVLTEIVTEERALRRPVDDATLEALTRSLEQRLLERLGPEVQRIVEERLARTLATTLDQAIEGLRSEIRLNLQQMVREAVAGCVASVPPPKNPE
jgi:hypothetical protein